MANQDFTTWTEQDGANQLTISSSQIDWTNIQVIYYDFWVVKDFGAGHFGDFEHLFKMNVNNIQGGYLAGNWCLANTVGDLLDIPLNGGLEFYIYKTTPCNLYLDANDTGVHYDSMAYADNSTYYVTISRTGTTYTAEIYSDASRTTLVDTLTCTCPSTTWRYL